jgi:hypothetical protein
MASKQSRAHAVRAPNDNWKICQNLPLSLFLSSCLSLLACLLSKLPFYQQFPVLLGFMLAATYCMKYTLYILM